MLIGRRKGPRFEVSRIGVRLVGYSAWPVLFSRRNARGELLRPSYAERVAAAAHERERESRVVTIEWGDVLALGIDYRTRDALRSAFGRRAVAPRDWDFEVELSAATTGWDRAASVPVHWSSPVQPPFVLPDPWVDVPRRGLAVLWVRTEQGVWALDAPLDRRPLFAERGANEVQAALAAWSTDAAARTPLPVGWPTSDVPASIGGTPC